MIINNSFFPISTGARTITGMKQQLDTLQTQLGTGKKANSLSEMGADTLYDVTLRGRLNQLGSYGSTMQSVNLRLDALDNGITSLSQIRSDATAAVSSSGSIDRLTAQAQARNQLANVVDVLNTDINGRYLFGGRTTDKAPVANTDALLNGAGGKAGFYQVARERLDADLGTGTGRLQVDAPSVPGDTVTVAEDSVSPFGFKLASVQTSGTGISASLAGTTPESLSVQFTSDLSNLGANPPTLPSVTVKLKLPDGGETSVTLQGVQGPAGAGEFTVGTPAEMAANLKSALGSALTGKAKTDLTAASTYVAADSFFNGHGDAIQRVDATTDVNGDGTIDAKDATGLVDGSATTVQWYRGADDADARGAVTAKVDPSITVNYGVQANEKGILGLVRGLAAMSVTDYPGRTDSELNDVFHAKASAQIDRLSTADTGVEAGLRGISLQLGLVKTTLGSVKTRQDTYKSQLQGLLDDTEKVPQEEVAMKLIALQTQLQASYQVVSKVSQLSLVNYLK